MRILVCDRCGKEDRIKGIVGKEFDHDFRTLTPAYRHSGVVDVCKKCFDEIVKEKTKLDKEQRESVMDRLRSIVSPRS